MAPKTPDGLPDFDEISGAATSSSTAKTDIWNIPDDLRGKTLITDYGYKYDGGTNGRLAPEDVAYKQQASLGSRAILGVDPQTKVPGGPYALPISMYGENPKGYLELQRALFAAGYFGSKSSKSIAWGADTASTMEAWTALLRDTVQQQSLGQNVTWQDMLDRALKSTKAGGTATEKPPLVLDYTDPEQVAGVVQRAAQASLGRNLSGEEIEHFVSEFRAAETTYAKDRYAASTDVKGGTHTMSQPSLEGRADAYVQEGHGTEIAGNNMADYVRAIEQMLG